MNSKTDIFCLHRISDEYSPAYPPIPVKVFDRICSFINRNYFVIPLDELENNFYSKKKRAIVTFDDAYLDFYENALPLLIKYKIPAVQHVITNCAQTGDSFWTQKLNKIIEAYSKSGQEIIIPELNINALPKSNKEIEQLALSTYIKLLSLSGRDKILSKLQTNCKTGILFTKMMTWNELKECSGNNITIGSHTHQHSNLTKLSNEEIELELAISKSLIESNIPNYVCNTIAFPNGQFNDHTIEIAKSLDYKYLFSTEEFSVRSTNIPTVLPRFSLYHNVWWKNIIKLKMIGIK